MTGRARRTTDRSTIPDSLAERLLQAGRGDEGAFAEIYDVVAPAVYGIALRVTRDPHEAEEAAQNALVEIWRHAGRFDPERGSAMGWMMTLAHRRAVDHVRSRVAARARDDTWHKSVELAPASDATFDQARANLNARVVQAALGRIPVVQRQAVELAYFEGYTYLEVSRLMDAPLGTTKTRMRTALRHLRGQVEDMDGAKSA